MSKTNAHPTPAAAYRLQRLVSGGQTGVDQLGLEVARTLGIPTGGVAPKGYLTEYGPDPRLREYGLVEHESADDPARTLANVGQSDGTVIFGAVRGGTPPGLRGPGQTAPGQPHDGPGTDRLAHRTRHPGAERGGQPQQPVERRPTGRLPGRAARRPERQRAYFAKINAGFVRHENHRVLVAEGDSWFQFFGRDVINWLDDEKKYAIFSMSYAGDWLANILFEEKYVEELSIHKPSAFLVSGGGNDLVGSNRLAIMTCLNPHGFVPIRRTRLQELREAGRTEEQANRILNTQRHILPEYYAFLLILKCQYYLMFSSLRKAGDLPTMAILTQGYDYTIPHAGIRFDWRTPLQPLLNWALVSGKWMSQPLMIRGINKPGLQRSIIMAMIFELNEMFVSLAVRDEFPYLYHIDSRGNAAAEDWFDELHLKPLAFKRVADAYQQCLTNHFEHVASTPEGTKNPQHHQWAKPLRFSAQ